MNNKLLTSLIVILLFVSIPFGQMKSVPVEIEPNQTVQVVTTFSFLEDFVQNILGQNSEVTSLIDASQDPHFYEPDSSDLTAMSNADLILGLGSPEFDEWLTDYIEDSGDQELQSKLEFVVDVESLEKVDPLTGVANPHIWLDPNNAKLMVNNTANILVERDLVLENEIEDNWFSYLNVLDEIINDINELKSNVTGTKVVVDHPSFFYLLSLLEYDRVGVLEEKEGEEPSPQHVQELTELMNEQNVDLIIASEIQAGDDVIELARSTNSKIVYLTPLPGISGAETYQKMMQFNLERLKSPSDPPSDDSLLGGEQFLLFIPFVSVIAIVRKMKNSKLI